MHSAAGESVLTEYPILLYIKGVKYEVTIKKQCMKNIARLSRNDRDTLSRLLMDLRDKGPVQPNYKNYSRLGKGKYHCHLSYHWIACWECKDGTYVVEVYYVGSRESAPY